MQLYTEKYVLSLKKFEIEEKLFIIRQLKRMPDLSFWSKFYMYFFLFSKT